MKQFHAIFQYSQGNMAEYVLPAVLIGMVAVAGLTWTLSGQFAAQGGRSLFQAESSQVGVNGKTLLSSRSFGKNPYLQTVSLTLRNGKTIQIPDIPVSVADNIDVDGGHGTTEKLLAAMEKLRQALVESGELTEADSQPFKDLANAGHGFGESQAFIERLMVSCGQNKKCIADHIYQNGSYIDQLLLSGLVSAPNSLNLSQDSLKVHALTEQEMQALDVLAPSYKTLIASDPYFNYDIKNMRVGSNFRQYLKSYQEVMALTNIKGTATAAVVQNLATGIIHLQSASFNSASKIANSLTFSELKKGVTENKGSWAAVTPEDYTLEIKAHFNIWNPKLSSEYPQSLLEKSTATHTQSSVICKVGQRSDDGKNCH
jgi:hypothetical protein